MTSAMYLIEKMRCITKDSFAKYSSSDESCLRIYHVPGLYFSAAEKRSFRTTHNVVLASGNALSNSNDTRTASIAS